MVGKVLIAMNPYKEDLHLYSDAEISKYRNGVADDLPPHIFLIGKYCNFFIILQHSASVFQLLLKINLFGSIQPMKHSLACIC